MKKNLILRGIPVLLAGFALYLGACAHQGQGVDLDTKGAVAEGSSKVRITEGKLDNGLKVLVLEDHSAPVVTLQVWYRVGSRNEKVGIRGLAHLLEHMMFKGSANVGPEEHARIVDSVGGQENAFTSEDVTAYFDTVPAEHLSLVMELEAERMGRLKLDESHFLKEREVVKEELRMRYQNDPVGALFNKFREMAFTKHPYNWTAGGSIEDLDGLGLKELKAFYDSYYAPNNAVLIVVGDTNFEKVMGMAKEHFGVLPARKTAAESGLLEPEQKSMRKEVLRMPTQLPIIIGGFKTPAARHPDMAVLEVIDRILSSGKSSRLHQALVRQQRLAVFSGSWNQRMRDPGLFLIFAGFMPNHKPELVEAALLAEVSKLGKEGPTAAELAKAKKQLTAEYQFKLTNMQRLGFEIGDAELVEGDYKNFLEGADPYAKIGAEDVKRVVAEHLNQDKLTLAVLLPPESGQAKPAAKPESKASDKLDLATWPTAERFTKLGIPPDAAIQMPKVTQKKLDNGLTLLVIERHEQPVVYLDYVIRGGKQFDPEGKSGLAELVAGMITQGTVKRTADQIATAVDGMGAQLSGYADDERYGLFGRFLAADWAEGLDLFADVLLQASFPKEELEKIRPQYEGGVRRLRDQPTALAREHLNYLIYGYGHPRGRPTTLASLKAIDSPGLLQAYQSAFGPDGAIIAVTGDVTPEAVLADLEKSFASWKTQASVPAWPATPGKQDTRKLRFVDKADLTQATMFVGHMGINLKDPDYFSLKLGNWILGGGGFSSRMMKSIRSKGGKTYGVGSWVSTGLEPGSIGAYTFTRNSETGETLKMLLDEIKLIRKDGVTKEELLKAKNAMAGSYPVKLQPPGAIGDAILDAVFYGFGPDRVKNYRRNLVKPSLAEVNAALAKHLDPENMAIVVVGKAAEVASQLSDFGKMVKVDYLEATADEDRKPAAEVEKKPAGDAKP